MDSEDKSPSALQFYPFSTIIDSSFWLELRRVKLDQLKLNSTPIDVCPFFTLNHGNCFAQLNYESFQSFVERKQSNCNLDCNEYYFNGKLIVFNTKTDFEQSDKRELIRNSGIFVWENICDETRTNHVDSNLDHFLCQFLIIVYGDLKNYCFHYWCAYPSLACSTNITLTSTQSFKKFFTDTQLSTLLSKLSSIKDLFFVILINDSNIEICRFDSFWSQENIEQLVDWKSNQVLFTFYDPCMRSEYPSWLLRNYLCYIVKRLQQLKKKFPNNSLRDFVKNIENQLYIASLRTLHGSNGDCQEILKKSLIYKLMQLSNDSTLSNNSLPKVVGWERNKNCENQLVPNYVDVSNILNPEIVCRDALYLNLKLMKWRLAPTLDLELIRNTRCLLLGSGTLGCNVARALVAWGVGKITFADNRTVSFSNPARQSLYTFQDAVGGGKSKAKTAADALKQIQPGIDSQGFDLNIKMPGHQLNKTNLKIDQEDIELLEQLIQEHDVIFLLTDTRESRWLPTVIATSSHKIVINVALGFDTFLVQRHGLRLRTDNPIDQKFDLYPIYQDQLNVLELLKQSNIDPPFLLGSELGCYFCNDVFAPGNSMKDRTLDQQCTVTRPGLSMAASGYAVELLISMLQHPAKILAPSIYKKSTAEESFDLNLNDKQIDLVEVESLLGLIPHQFRGFLARFESITPSFKNFDQCVACSTHVIDRYRNDGLQFIFDVIHNSKILEDITGLQMYHNVDDVDTFSLSDDCNVEIVD